MVRVTAPSAQCDAHWRQRVQKEEATLAKGAGAKPDPFARSLQTLLSAEEKAAKRAPASQISGYSSKPSRISHARPAEPARPTSLSEIGSARAPDGSVCPSV